MKFNYFLVIIILSFGLKQLDSRSSETKRDNVSKAEKTNESSSDHMSMNHDMAAEFISNKKNSGWNDKGTWNKAGMPKACCSVVIQEGTTVTISGSVHVKNIIVKGTLKFSNAKDTDLKVETIKIVKGGSLEIGSEKKRLHKKRKVIITFTTDGNLDTKDPMFTHQLGLINHGGKLTMNGKKVTRIVETESSGGKTVELSEKVRGWNANDELLFPATEFERDTDLKNEVRIIENAGSKFVTLTSSVSSQNLPEGHKSYVANLTSNIVIQSESTDLLKRGHVMIMPHDDDNITGDCGHNYISGVTFKNLGRTDKSMITSAKNQKMMYPLHFHHCGHTKKPYKVENNVIWNTPGWGFVNHRSSVDFRNNVVYSFTGAGFVTEFGSERGSFKGNLAVGGIGLTNKKGKVYPYRRLYITNEVKDRLKQADLGFHGDGFWMTSPFVDVEDNVSAGNHGSGFVWYLLGVDDIIKNSGVKAMGSLRLEDMPIAAQNILGKKLPKRWYKNYGDEFYLIQDLPIFGKIKNNRAYANYVGMRVRYVANVNMVAAGKFFGMESKAVAKKLISGSDDTKKIHVHQSNISDTTLLNNEIGLHSTYSSNINYNGLIIKSKQYSIQDWYKKGKDIIENSAPTGIELNHSSNRGHSIEDLEITGYPICMRVTKDKVEYELKKATIQDCKKNQNGENYIEFEMDQDDLRDIRI